MKEYLGTIAKASTEPVRRDRIGALIKNAVKNPLVVISAGTGTGKTVAASSYLAEAEEHVLWIHLSELDSYSVHFWGLFTQVAGTWDQELAAQLSRGGFPETLPDMSWFLELLAARIHEDQRLILVFDDFHNLKAGPVKSFVQSLIEARLPGLTVMLISGTPVELDLTEEVRAVNLTDQHLRFTREEVRIYYKALGIVLSQRRLDRIFSLTEGWAFGVYLLGLRLQRGELLTDAGIDDGFAYLFRVYDQHVFGELDQEEQRLLTQLSVLGSFHLEMAADVTGRSTEELLLLFRRSMFVSYQPGTDKYYFHSLFASFLAPRRALLEEGALGRFLLRAGQWAERRGLILEAAHTYLHAGRHGDLARVVSRMELHYIKKDIAAFFADMMGRIPREVLRQHLRLWHAGVMFLYNAGEVPRAQGQLKELRTHLESAGDSLTPEGREILGEVHVLYALRKLRQGDGEYGRHLGEAARLLPEGSKVFTGRAYPFLSNGNALQFLSPQPGDLQQMIEMIFQSRPLARKVLNNYGAGFEFLAAAEVYYYQGELHLAQEHAVQAIEEATLCDQWDIACNAHYLLMRAGFSGGNFRQVKSALASVIQSAAMVRHDRYFLMPDIARFFLYLHSGLEEYVAPWIKEEQLLSLEYVTPHAGRGLSVMTQYRVHTGRYQSAVDFIDRVTRICVRNGQWFSRLKLMIYKAIAYERLGQHRIAAKCLEGAYSAAEGNNIIMTFVECGRHMGQLIESVRRIPGRADAVPSEWLDRLYLQVQDYQTQAARVGAEFARSQAPVRTAPGFLDALTKREREALQLLCEGRTNEEIGYAMGIATGTVKATLSSAYRRIGAANRADAVRIASGGHPAGLSS